MRYAIVSRLSLGCILYSSENQYVSMVSVNSLVSWNTGPLLGISHRKARKKGAKGFMPDKVDSLAVVCLRIRESKLDVAV